MLGRILSFPFAFLFVLLTMSSGDKPGTRVVANPNATNSYIAQYGKTMVSAHRSGAGIAPENTLMAFESCLNSKEFKIDIFEFDVQLTKDGKLVLLHNSTYDSTSNAEEAFGKKNIRPNRYTFKELQVLNLGENFSVNGKYPYRGLRGKDIPYNLHVVEVKDLLSRIEKSANKKYRYIIEIKDGSFDGYKAADRLYSILKELKLLDRTIAASFWPDLAFYYDLKYPDMTRSAGIFEVLQFYYWARTDRDISKEKRNYDVLQIPYGNNVMPWGIELINLGTKQLTNYAHKYNIAVQYWTPNSKEDMLTLRENGADAIMTDWPNLANQAYNKK